MAQVRWDLSRPFDPREGTVIRTPAEAGPGYWVGAPGVFHDAGSGTIYLLYRVRRPRGVEPDRGAELHLAASTDGRDFTDLWTLEKGVLGTPSIERCALNRAPDGRYLLYLSYVDPADNRWRTDVIASPDPCRFEPAARRALFTAGDVGAEGVKDPWLFRCHGLYVMVLSFATLESGARDERLHATADAYNTGLVRSRTGWGTSLDGETFAWQGELFGPSADGWDRYAARIGCLWHAPPVWIALYDGSADVAENYEERCGLAVGADWRNLARMSRTGPWLTVPHGTGSVRYFDRVALADRTLFYYEMVRADGSHELRCYEMPHGI